MFAQPGKTDAQHAIAVARAAKEDYDEGDWAAALSGFETAERLAHSPVLVLYAARCHRNLGRLVRARALYQSVVNEQLAANASPPFLDAKRDAEADLLVLEPRIPRLTIDRSSVSSAWTAKVDGEVALTENPILLDPGRHEVVAFEEGSEKMRETIELQEGEARTFAVRAPLPPEPPAPAVAPAPRPAPLVPERKEDAPAPSVPITAWIPGGALLALGLGGVGAGIGTRVLAFQKVDDTKAGCLGNRCPPSAREEIEQAETLQTVSTISFVVGGAAAATGVVLLVVLPDRESSPPAEITLGPSSMTMTLSF